MGNPKLFPATWKACPWPWSCLAQHQEAMDDHMNHSTLASLSQSKAHAEAESMLFVRVEWAAQSGCYILQRTEKVPSVLYPPLQVSSKVISISIESYILLCSPIVSSVIKGFLIGRILTHASSSSNYIYQYGSKDPVHCPIESGS